MTSSPPTGRRGGAITTLMAVLTIALAAGGYFFGKSYASSELEDAGADPASFPQGVNIAGLTAAGIGLLVGVFLLTLVSGLVGRRDRMGARVVVLVMGLVLAAVAVWLATAVFPDVSDAATIIDNGS